MRNTITIIAAATAALLSGIQSTPASAHDFGGRGGYGGGYRGGSYGGGYDRHEHHGGGTATAILGVVAGAGLGLAIGANRGAGSAYPVQSYQGSGYGSGYGQGYPQGYAGGGYVQPQPVYVPQPRPAPNGAACMGWDGFRYVPVRRCGN